MGGRRSYLLKFVLVLLLLTVVLYAGRGVWLAALGNALIHDEGAAKADIAVVLAGDSWGHRLIKGAELVRQGYVPQVLVSGPPGILRNQRGRRGDSVGRRQEDTRPSGSFRCITAALSTSDEAVAVLDVLQAAQCP